MRTRLARLKAVLSDELIGSASGESWRPVVGHEDDYEVSSYGRIRNLETGRISYGAPTNRYLMFNFNGDRQYVHRVVLRTFVGPPPFPRAECNHRNFDRRDNRAANLEWCSHGENMRHAKNSPLRKRRRSA